MTKKRGFFRKKPSEYTLRENMVWMPYHRIRFDYKRSERDLIQRYGETALNAMFCGCAKSERELFMLFRPNYLKYELTKHSPRSEEIVGPSFHTGLEGILASFVKRIIELKDELTELRSELQKSRVRISRSRMIIPGTWGLKNEKPLSEKVAKLSATKNILSMCLNVEKEVHSIKVTGNSIFYYPTLVATLENKADEPDRYLIVNLVKSGLPSKHLSHDKALTELCDKNSACREIIANSITT